MKTRKNHPALTLTIMFLLVSAGVILVSAPGNGTNTSDNNPPRKVASLFEKTKLYCLGRYAVEVPAEAIMIFSDASFPSTIKVSDVKDGAYKDLALRDIEKLKRFSKSAEITYSEHGPVKNSWQIRYYESASAKIYKLHIFVTYLEVAGLTYRLSSSVREGETEATASARESLRIRSLRRREIDEVPREAGYCIESGFVSSDNYAGQEMVTAGIFLPSFPDVTFSIDSNKNAYSDYSPSEFERLKREKLLLSVRVKQAQEDQGIRYPFRSVLREGPRSVQHWHGEESLIRRADGTHDFEWAFVGTPKDVANPSEFGVQMYTKVAHDLVGAADRASLTDEEAVALWDLLLAGLKFRVKVPGAPEGSYYFLPGAQAKNGAEQ